MIGLHHTTGHQRTNPPDWQLRHRARKLKRQASKFWLTSQKNPKSKDVFDIAGRVLSETAVKQRLEATRKWPSFSVCPWAFVPRGWPLPKGPSMSVQILGNTFSTLPSEWKYWVILEIEAFFIKKKIEYGKGYYNHDRQGSQQSLLCSKIWCEWQIIDDAVLALPYPVLLEKIVQTNA